MIVDSSRAMISIRDEYLVDNKKQKNNIEIKF
jgi:hypothetical protein